MKRFVTVLSLLVVALGACCLLVKLAASPSHARQYPDTPAHAPAPLPRYHGTSQYEKAMSDAMAQAQKEYEERMNGTRKGFVHLPNPPTGPGQALPIKVNFYQIHDDCPTYLLCTYEVKESSYTASKEPAWLEASLQQIRDTGRQEFPNDVRWVAVILKNRAEHTDASNFEQSHKVGAIFAADDVFSPSGNLRTLVSAATMDRHPFVYSQNLAEPQRWMVVERHAAAAQAAVNQKTGRGSEGEHVGGK